MTAAMNAAYGEPEFPVGELLTARGTVVQAGDVLILTTSKSMTADQAAATITYLRRKLPGLADVILIDNVTGVIVADGSVLEPKP